MISSATIDADLFRDYFNDSAVLQVDGGTSYPVRIEYRSEPCRNYIDDCVQTVLDIHRRMSRGGDILAFLPSRAEVSLHSLSNGNLNASVRSMRLSPGYATSF